MLAERGREVSLLDERSLRHANEVFVCEAGCLLPNDSSKPFQGLIEIEVETRVVCVQQRSG